MQGSKKIDIHHLAIDVYACVDKSASLGDAGIVYQDIDATEALKDAVDSRLAFGRMGNIAANAQRIAAGGKHVGSRRLYGGFIDIQ